MSVHTELPTCSADGYVQAQIYTRQETHLRRKPWHLPTRQLTMNPGDAVPKRRRHFCIQLTSTRIYATVCPQDTLGISTQNVLTGSTELRCAHASAGWPLSRHDETPTLSAALLLRCVTHFKHTFLSLQLTCYKTYCKMFKILHRQENPLKARYKALNSLLNTDVAAN